MISPLALARSSSYRARHVFYHFLSPAVIRRFRTAAAHYSAPIPLIALRALRLYWIARFLPEESLSRGLTDPSVPISRHLEHFSVERLNGLEDAVNSPNSGMCRDKLLFHAYCAQHGLPTPRLLAVLSAHGSRTYDNRPLVSKEQWLDFVAGELPSVFIVKPRCGMQGRDVHLMGTAVAGSPDIALLSMDLQRLASGREDYLIEARLTVHEKIADLTGSSSMSCVRVVSVVDRSGTPQILAAYFRVVIGNSVTDNISDYSTGEYSGNILALPGLTDGVVHKAVVPNRNGLAWDDAETHPVTGKRIVSFALPYWDEVRSLVISAAAAFLPVRAIGWDVAITPDGPVLIEANERFKYTASGESVFEIRRALEASLQETSH